MKIFCTIPALAMLALASCQQPAPPPAPNPPAMVPTPKEADASQPVMSGNTPAAADVAALAALRAAFDPQRDPASDLATAETEARRGDLRIVLEVGQSSCDAAHKLADVFNDNSDLRRYRDHHFVWLRVNASAENPNAEFLRNYALSGACPQLAVLDAQGRLLSTQAAEALRKDGAWSVKAVKDWLERNSGVAK